MWEDLMKHRKKRTAFVPTVVFGTVVIGVVPACALSCGGTASGPVSADAATDALLGVADAGFRDSTFGVADVGFSVADAAFMRDSGADTRPFGVAAVAFCSFCDAGDAGDAGG